MRRIHEMQREEMESAGKSGIRLHRICAEAGIRKDEYGVRLKGLSVAVGSKRKAAGEDGGANDGGVHTRMHGQFICTAEPMTVETRMHSNDEVNTV